MSKVVVVNGKWRWANKVAPEPDNECSPLPFPFKVLGNGARQARHSHTHTHIRIYMSVGTSVSAEYPRQIEVLHQVTVEATTRLGSPRLASPSCVATCLAVAFCCLVLVIRVVQMFGQVYDNFKFVLFLHSCTIPCKIYTEIEMFKNM